MSVVAHLFPYVSAVVGVGGLITGAVGIRMATRRDKDAAMTQLQKDITEIKVTQASVAERLNHVVTKEDFAQLDA